MLYCFLADTIGTRMTRILADLRGFFYGYQIKIRL
jgi:hypothetical protein